MKHRSLVIFIGAVLLFASCGRHFESQGDQVTLQQRLAPHPNPTNYIFDATEADVKNAIKLGCKKWREELSAKYSNKVWAGDGDAVAKRFLTQALQISGEEALLWKGDGDALSKNLLTKPGNESDAYLWSDVSPIGESQVYYKNDQPLIYYADFHIHLSTVGQKKTRVDIATYNSSVAAGVDQSWSPHGPSLIEVNVDPTTIEEYQILLHIGEQVGTKDMPPLVIPGPDAAVKELTLSRGR
jgi:hypothetical protein